MSSAIATSFVGTPLPLSCFKELPGSDPSHENTCLGEYSLKFSAISDAASCATQCLSDLQCTSFAWGLGGGTRCRISHTCTVPTGFLAKYDGYMRNTTAAGCGTTPSPPTPTPPTSPSTLIRADDPNIQFIGRSRPGPHAGTLEFDMAGCEIRATVVLKQASCITVELAQMHEPHPPPLPGHKQNADQASGYEANAFVTWVNGKRQGRGGYNATFVTNVTDADVHPYPMDGAKTTCAAPFAAGTHSLRVFKATEADFNAGSPIANYVTFHGFSISSTGVETIPSPPLPTRKIEFVGDSITAGFCNLCHVVPDPRAHKADNTDHLEAYGASWDHQICEILDAQCHTAAWSGIGMVKNCCGGNETMPTIYQQTLSTVTAAGGGTAWDFSKWKADALVINLGTNDRSAVTGPRYLEKYKEVVMEASQHYPNVHVFLACGPMTDEYCDPVQKVIANVTARGVKAHFLDQRGFINKTNGCCSHPSIAVDNAMATSGAALIKKTLGW